MKAKQGDTGADVFEFEREIDNRMYRLFELTREEVARRAPNWHSRRRWARMTAKQQREGEQQR